MKVDERLREPWPDPRNASGITRLELVCGWAVGQDDRAPDIAQVAPLGDPVEALEAALLPAVAQQPCCVAFSGGRDSSVLLAAAARVARREGLPDPVAITIRWPGLDETEEGAWQETVVRHVGIGDWQVIDCHADMDMLGEMASAVIREHGVLWPPASHGIVPIFEPAKGGVLVYGDGGDQVFGGWRRVYLGEALGRRRRPVLRDATRIAASFAPFPVRARFEARRSDYRAPWLPSELVRAWRLEEGRALAVEPANWPGFLRWTRRERATVLALDALERIGRGVGAAFSTPLWDVTFLSSLAAWGGRFGRGRRSDLMVALFSELLPEAVLRRGTKAVMTRAYFSEATRRFAEEWTGPVPEPELVDGAALREEWLGEWPSAASASLLQAAWLLSLDDPSPVPRPARRAR